VVPVVTFHVVPVVTVVTFPFVPVAPVVAFPVVPVVPVVPNAVHMLGSYLGMSACFKVRVL
jgi:hypothetical protein